MYSSCIHVYTCIHVCLMGPTVGEVSFVPLKLQFACNESNSLPCMPPELWSGNDRWVYGSDGKGRNYTIQEYIDLHVSLNSFFIPQETLECCRWSQCLLKNDAVPSDDAVS